LIKYLQAANFMTFQAVGDADTLIAEGALQVAATTGPVTVVADDTDVLVLLGNHFRPHMADVFMVSKKSVCSKTYSVVICTDRFFSGKFAATRPCHQWIQCYFSHVW